MFALIGLGNPGSQYQYHRHNIGFMAIDALHQHMGAATFRKKNDNLIADARFDDQRILLIKPQTFMNASGRAVQQIMQHYKLAKSDIMVIHDEMALELGVLRCKTDGGHAGHNGIRDIITAIGNDFARLRIGIGHPGNKAMVTNHVLAAFNTRQMQFANTIIEQICQHHGLMLQQKFAPFLQAVNEDIAKDRLAFNQDQDA